MYVKNKPTSDRLLAESGKFFQSKQLELGDKMDLASYLLKPVQRLGKYSLFLDGISKTTKQKTELLKAKKIIQFQVSSRFFNTRKKNGALIIATTRTDPILNNRLVTNLIYLSYVSTVNFGNGSGTAQITKLLFRIIISVVIINRPYTHTLSV